MTKQDLEQFIDKNTPLQRLAMTKQDLEQFIHDGQVILKSLQAAEQLLMSHIVKSVDAYSVFEQQEKKGG